MREENDSKGNLTQRVEAIRLSTVIVISNLSAVCSHFTSCRRHNMVIIIMHNYLIIDAIDNSCGITMHWQNGICQSAGRSFAF